MRLIPVISYFLRLRQDPFRNNRMRFVSQQYYRLSFDPCHIIYLKVIVLNLHFHPNFYPFETCFAFESN
ncbi:hypothetical protein BpHYR1_047928 [Brachionus plicatilis]|uniref:Uncharacterized protein n=1 Tax=Brachionus plicatilis TaxID=10195 RepID=A0A3M7RLJ5_BRAPC|nr:hypothetical protein BpHYR1_047928 [Brachionus plicatilis]